MTADVYAQNILFKSQQLFLGILSHIRERYLIFLFLFLWYQVKQTHLAFPGVFTLPCFIVKKDRRHCHLLPSGARKRVHSSGLNKVFNGTAVHLFVGHTVDKIFHGTENTVFLPFFQDCVYDRPSHAFDRRKSIADTISWYREAAFSFVDIRRQDGNIHHTAAG